MDAEEAAAAILDVSGDADDLELEDEDKMVSFGEQSPHRSRDPHTIAQGKILKISSTVFVL